MKINHVTDIEGAQVDMPGAADCEIRWLVGENDGAPNFAMRQFDVSPGGHTPRHSHPYEHEIYVLEGEGEVIEGDTPRPLKKGDFLYVAPDEVHQFRNTGDGTMKFLCMVPHVPEGTPVKVVPDVC